MLRTLAMIVSVIFHPLLILTYMLVLLLLVLRVLLLLHLAQRELDGARTVLQGVVDEVPDRAV